MVKYRHRLEIIADILNVAGKGVRKTRIMYVANLSYSLLEKYLEETVDLGFIYPSNHRYEVTEKGRTFLEKYNEFSSRYSKVDYELQKMLFEKEILEKLCETHPRSNPRTFIRRRR